MAKKMRHFGRWAGLFSQLLLCVRAMSIVISPPKWPVMPFPIEYLLTSEVTLKSKLLSSTRLRAQLRALKCKHLCWQLLLTFHLEDNKSYFRKCGKNRWLHWCFAASKVSCQEHQNLQTFKTLLLSSPHPRKTFNFKFQLRFSSNGFQLKLSHWKIG